MRPYSAGATTAADELRGFLEGSIGFYDSHRSHMKALVQVLMNHP